jgi:DNA-binding GntR family transcriptional regulator
MSDMTSSSLATVSVTDALRAALRERILDGQLPGGAAVAEVDVARWYGVSRPSAKTAIRALVHEGLLRHEPNRAAYVPRLSAEDVEDLFLVRVPLEEAVTRLLAADGRPLGVAQDAVRALRRVEPDAPTSRFVEADLRFHEALVDATGSPRLRRLFASLSGEIHLCMVQTRRLLGRNRIAGEHAEILRAIESHSAGAVDLMREHLAGAREALRL